jgi:hypothetical protein
VEQREAAQVERDQADRRRQTTEKVPDTAAAAIWQWSMLGRADRLMERKKAELFIGQPRGRARVESDPSVKCRKSELRGLFFSSKIVPVLAAGLVSEEESPSDVASQKPAQNTKPSLIRIHPDVREGRAL